MGFFDDLPAPEPAPPRRHHPWEPPEAEFPGIGPIDTLLLGRTGQVAVAVTGLSAFSAGIEIFLTARIRPSSGHPGEHLPGGPSDLAAARRSFRFGLQFCDGGKAAGSPGDRRTDHDSEPGGPVRTRSPGAADPTRSSPGGGRGRCRPPGRWSSSASGRRSASPYSAPASTRSSSLTRHGAASGYGRKTKPDSESLPLAAADRNPAAGTGPALAGYPRAAGRERPLQRQPVLGPPIMTRTPPGPGYPGAAAARVTARKAGFSRSRTSPAASQMPVAVRSRLTARIRARPPAVGAGERLGEKISTACCLGASPVNLVISSRNAVSSTAAG